MTFDDKPAHEITDDQIIDLVEKHVRERQDLEFKLTLDRRDHNAVAELLRDVAAMANGGGGYVFYGIREDEDHRAVALEGITGDLEGTANRIRDLCLKHLVPRAKGLEVYPRRVDGKGVIIVRVPRSALAPHMMTQTEGTEFWIRHGDRKVYMRHEEIREAFVGRPPKVRRPRPQKRRRLVQLVQNSGFERGLQGWGTGLLEDMPNVQSFARAHGFVSFGGAVAKWFADARTVHTGRRSLRVEHQSSYSEHVFSTLSQRIAVQPGAAYEVRFWAKVEAKGTGAFSLRVVPSRAEWDRFKVKIHESSRWVEYTRLFRSAERPVVDVRFVAEGPVKAWIDDVTVRKVGESSPRGYARLRELSFLP